MRQAKQIETKDPLEGKIIYVYYSYATLTTLGYGDVLPLTYWARSAATLEAVIGVLYTAVIVARLVGLYAVSGVDAEIETVENEAGLPPPARRGE